MKILIVYLALVNLIGFVMMAIDKSQARNGGRRVPEKRLFVFAALGGALGSWIGMRAYRHKTKHMTFVVGMPALLVLNAACVYYLAKLITE
ncbi:DUF1294 domain-containing protein [Paenibacillus sp. D51F]